ncbi:MAG: sulfatase [Verrucomicrobiota bacterium]|nr:sulfatase [Verrucomicrobiota bacterium]
MKKRLFGIIFSIYLGFVNLVIGEKPNIIFIMSDDHTWQAVGSYESRFKHLNPTPNIDTLARRGMVFDQVICGNAICTPSRASIMTGQYSHINGVMTLDDRLPEPKQHLAHEMKKAGYQTAVIGKWHLRDLPSAFDYYKVLPGQGKYFDPEFFESGVKKKFRMQGHSTDCIMDSALDWFDNYRSLDKPFFLKLHFKAPHDYFEYAPRYESYLEDTVMPEPPSLWKRGEGSIATRGVNNELERVIGTSIGRRNFRRSYAADWQVADDLSDTEAKRAAYNIYLKKYLRCVKGVDDNIGRLLSYLKKEGLLENTVIVYTGDQGFFLGEHDMQDKRWAYEPSVRMPLIVSYPGVVPVNTRSDAIIENIDFPATMLDFAGLKTPSYMQGESFRTILETGKEPNSWKKAAYYQYWMHMAHHDVPGHIAMRTKRYKLIQFYGTAGNVGYRSERSKHATPAAWELYDLQVDPTESNNVYDDKKYRSTREKLKKQFTDLRVKVRASVIDEDFSDTAKARIVLVNQAINSNWVYNTASKQEAENNSKSYLEKFGNPETIEPYIVPWLRTANLDTK